MPLESYVWSSYELYLKTPGQRPGWLRVNRLLKEKGIPQDSEVGRRQLAVLMEKRRAAEGAADCEALRRDWVLGSEQFRQKTTMSLKWIAERLHAGNWTYVSNLLNERPATGAAQPVLALFQW